MRHVNFFATGSNTVLYQRLKNTPTIRNLVSFLVENLKKLLDGKRTGDALRCFPGFRNFWQTNKLGGKNLNPKLEKFSRYRTSDLIADNSTFELFFSLQFFGFVRVTKCSGREKSGYLLFPGKAFLFVAKTFYLSKKN